MKQIVFVQYEGEWIVGLQAQQTPSDLYVYQYVSYPSRIAAQMSNARGGHMRMLSRRLAVVATLALAAATTAAAQRPQTRQGFWIGFGLGYGSAGLSCDGCGTLDRDGALSGYLKLGGTLSSRLLLGAETNGWTKRIQGSTVTLANASVAAYVYPQPAGGLFLRGGVGFAAYSEEGFDSKQGFGLTLGLGYDVRVGTNVSITPVGNINWGSIGDANVARIPGAGMGVTGLKQNVIQIAVGVTFH